MLKAEKNTNCDCGCGPTCGCASGKRCSRRRKAVLQTLSEAKGHLTAEQVYRSVGQKLPGTGLATVYRSLKCLCGCGKARELKYGDRPAVYEAAGVRSPHGHLLCLACGAVREFSDPAADRLRERLAAEYGFAPQAGWLEIRGTCARCAGVKERK
ncbi:MAG: transcriptional repressor [Elusimicrobiales bacterium]|nr:transcriptional repressor [Elusimicrobiales bacterium]